MNTRLKKLFIYGYGYTASHLAESLEDEYFVTGSTRNVELQSSNKNINLINDNLVADYLKNNHDTHILISVPPNDKGDIFIQNYSQLLIQNKNLEWVGYLSATNVYGDHNGEFVNESSETKPLTQKGINRLLAENQWQELSSQFNFPVKILRLAGIYGPDRNIKDRILRGVVKNIVKENQFFSRVHVEDIVSIIKLSMETISQNYIYNIADDLPSSLQDVIKFLCDKHQILLPEPINIRDIEPKLLKESFFLENKKIDNSLIKKDFSFNLKYPSYREGYQNL